jgi:hypothetical protein
MKREEREFSMWPKWTYYHDDHIHRRTSWKRRSSRYKNCSPRKEEKEEEEGEGGIVRRHIHHRNEQPFRSSPHK